MIALPWVQIAFGAAFATSFFALGWGSKDVVSDRAIAKLEKGYADERTSNAEALAKAEAANRFISSNWRAHVAEREAENARNINTRDTRIRALDRSNAGMSERIAKFARAGSTPGDTGATCRNVRERAQALGTFLSEFNELAGEAAKVADTLRDELALCRGYARALKRPSQSLAP